MIKRRLTSVKAMSSNLRVVIAQTAEAMRIAQLIRRLHELDTLAEAHWIEAMEVQDEVSPVEGQKVGGLLLDLGRRNEPTLRPKSNDAQTEDEPCKTIGSISAVS